MSSSALRAAWEAAQKPGSTGDIDLRDQSPPSDLKAAWQAAQVHGGAKSPASARMPAIQQAGDEALGQAIADEQQSIPEKAASHALNVAQGIPGLERGEALAGSLGSKLTKNPLSYEQSRDALRSATEKIGGKTSFAEHVLGGASLLPFLPVNAAAAGGALGAADQALSADTESLGRRAANTALGGATGVVAGHVIGKVAQTGTNALRTMLAKNPADNLIARQAQRALSAKTLYDAAAKEGQANVGSAQIAGFLQEPDIAPIVERITQSRQGAAVTSDPEMLDLVYKELADQGQGLKKSLAAVDPRNANSNRFQQREIGLQKGGALNAADTAMPSYRDAVTDFAKQSGEIEAFGKGYTAQHGGGTPPAFGGLLKKTPQGLAEAAKSFSPEETQAASEGVLGRAKLGGQSGGGRIKRAFSTAPEVKNLRALNDNQIADILQKLGIVSVNSAVTP